MPNTPRNIEEKPYNACLDCANLGKTCDGPNFLAMTIERWVEWCKLRKMYLHMTAQQLSDASGVSLPTIERIFSGRTKDPALSTVQLITKALVNGSWGMYPCSDPNGEAAELAARCQQLQKDLADMTLKKDHFKRLSEDRIEMLKTKDGQLKAADINMGERADFLRRKDKAIGFLGAALAVVTALLIVALGSDAIIPLF